MVPAGRVAEETLPLLTTYCAAPPLGSFQVTRMLVVLVTVADSLDGAFSVQLYVHAYAVHGDCCPDSLAATVKHM